MQWVINVYVATLWLNINILMLRVGIHSLRLKMNNTPEEFNTSMILFQVIMESVFFSVL